MLHAQEPNGVHHLASVLGTARWVVVFDEVRAALVREACRTFGLDPRKVVCTAAPAPLLPHPELVRHERVSVVLRDDLATNIRTGTATTATATGRAAEAAEATDRAGSRIARAAVARLDRAEPVTAARVLRLGVVPATTGSAAELGLPDDVVLPAAEIAAALREPDRLDALTEAGSAQLQAHRPTVFAALLVELANMPTPTLDPGVGSARDSVRRDPAAGRSGTSDPVATVAGAADAGGTGPRVIDAGTLDLTVVLESPQEGAPSVDRCGRMLVTELRELPAEVRLHPVQLRMPSVVRSVPVIGRRHLALNLDRVVARYPVAIGQLLRADRVGDGAGFFHLADHVYAHLVGRLPAARTGVYCHDLDGFAPVLDPSQRAHPLTRILARDALRGLAEAALVFHSTRTVGEQLTATGLIDPDRLVLAPLGAAAVFDVAADHALDAQRDAITGGHPYLLHVGSDIPRKRLDVLLETFARLLPTFPGLLLVQVGAATLPTDRASLRTNGLPTDAVLRPRDVDDALLASFYRGAQLVLVPSEAEGFGMPVVEALRCGSIVLASDLPVFREIAGDAILTAPVGDVEAFVATATTVLQDPSTAPSPAVRAAAAEPYTWRRHASSILDAYRRLHVG
ncbi:MAG: glycosyltransferase [Nakamurella sp.]